MRIAIQDKLKMVKLHIKEGKSLSHVSEIYGGYDVSSIKYLINLYHKHGEVTFRMYQLNFDKETLLVYKGYKEKYHNNFIENI